LGNALLTSDTGNISITDWILKVLGTLDGTAQNNLTVTNSNITAGNTNLTATNGNLIVSGGTASLGNAQLYAGDNLSATGWGLTSTGALDGTAQNNLSVANSNLIAGNTNLTATSGDLSISGTTVQLDNAWLKSGNNVAIMNSPKFNVGEYLGIDAQNRIVVNNVVARIGNRTIGLAEFDALGFYLFDWHFFSPTVLLAGIDIYNDPIYLNSLAYDRIVKIINGRARSSMSDDQDEEETENIIDGHWLLEEDVPLEILTDQEQGSIPVANYSMVLEL
jgi:hypothetical protein